MGNKAGHCFTYNNCKDYERDADHREEPSWHHINQSPASVYRHLSYINCYSAATTILLTKSGWSGPKSTTSPALDFNGRSRLCFCVSWSEQRSTFHSNLDGWMLFWLNNFPESVHRRAPLAESSSPSLLLSAFHLVGGFRWVVVVVRSARIFCVQVTDRGLDDMVVHCDSAGIVPMVRTEECVCVLHELN